MQGLLANLIKIWSLVQALPALGGGFFVLLKAMPALIGLAREVIQFLHQVDDYYERWALVKEFREAVRVAKETGDTSAIEKLFGGKKDASPADPRAGR
jgi:hypothetical protein